MVICIIFALDFDFFVHQLYMKTAFFTFGKFSPPTLGHKLMIDEMIKMSRNSDVYVVSSESVRPENAPINVNQKKTILKKMFKGTKVKVKSAKSPLEFVKSIEGKYDRVNMIVGENRVGAFNWIKKQKVNPNTNLIV